MTTDSPRKHDDIVEVGEANTADESLLHDGHQALVGRRRVAKTEGHFDHLEEAAVRDESSFLYV